MRLVEQSDKGHNGHFAHSLVSLVSQVAVVPASPTTTQLLDLRQDNTVPTKLRISQKKALQEWFWMWRRDRSTSAYV